MYQCDGNEGTVKAGSFEAVLHYYKTMSGIRLQV